MGVIASWAAEYIFGISSMGFFLMHVLVWFLFDYALLTCVEVGLDGFNKCHNKQSLIIKNSFLQIPPSHQIYTHKISFIDCLRSWGEGGGLSMIVSKNYFRLSIMYYIYCGALQTLYLLL